MIRLNQVSAVSGSATLLINNVQAQGGVIVFTNGDATNKVFLGFGTGTTSVNGAVIPPYGIIQMPDVVTSSPIYAIASAGTVPVGIFYGDLAPG